MEIFIFPSLVTVTNSIIVSTLFFSILENDSR